MAVITVRIDDQDREFLERYATLKGIKVSTLLRNAALAEAEDEMDRQAFDLAEAEFQKDNTTFTTAEVRKALGL